MTFDAHVHLEASLRLNAVAHRQPADGQLFGSLVAGVLRESSRHDVSSVLLRYNPARWVERGVQLKEQLAVLGELALYADDTWGIALHTFVTVKREDGRHAWGTALTAIHNRIDTTMVGVDISRSYDVRDLQSVPLQSDGSDVDLAAYIREVRDAGLIVAAHLGWYDSIVDATWLLENGATRFGHGTPFARDSSWDHVLATLSVVIEVCPSAFEFRTGRTIATLPVGRWLEAGIRVEVGTDHPLGLGTNLAHELEGMRGAFPSWSSTPTPHGISGRI